MNNKPVYRSVRKREDLSNEAAVIHCSDHRFQAGFREFLTEGLKLRSYALLAVPGGGHFAAVENFLPKFAKVGVQNLKFLIKRSGARRVILIGHDDCLFFRDQLQYLFTESELNQKQIANLKRARAALSEHFPTARVELYFADVTSDGSMQFVELD
jgi:hypothetical protein